MVVAGHLCRLRPGTRGFQTANEIHIPVGQDVRLELESADVIHSFWVPSLAGKQDLVPGRSNVLLLRAEKPGIYRGQCAEFCGLQHSHMAVLVIAEAPADYERWAAGQRQTAMPPSGPEARRRTGGVPGKALRRLPHHSGHVRQRHDRT